MKRSRIAACALAAVAALAVIAHLAGARSPHPAGGFVDRMDGDEPRPALALASGLERESLRWPGGELFALSARTKRAAEQVVPSPAPLPPPSFPYRYAGWLNHGTGLVESYLVRSDGKLHALRTGAVLDGWRIDRVTQDSIDVTYVARDLKRSFMLATLTGEAEAEVSARADAGERVALSAPPAPAPKNSPTSASAGIAAGIALPYGRSEARIAGPAAAAASAAAAPFGEVAPTQGSMPTSHAGGTGSATIRTGSIPSGRLGDATPSGRRLGQ